MTAHDLLCKAIRRFMSCCSAPPRCFVGIQSQCEFGNHFMRKCRVGRMESAGAGIAEESLEFRLLEHSKTTGGIHRAINNAPRSLDRAILCRNDLDGPVGVLNSVGPVS